MGATADYLAIDLGASSGRGVVGSFDGQRLTLREVHRFPNTPLERPTGMHWDVARLFGEVKAALARAASGGTLAGIGVDTWGVDYGLIDAGGSLLAPPHHYRDPRTHGIMQEAFASLPRARLYERTGIQFLEFNTLYQLLAERKGSRLDSAATLLFMPDLFHFWLTGQRLTEASIASTSQLYDPGAGEWASDVVEVFGLPRRILPQIAEPGTPVGALLGAVAAETGAGDVPVIAPASHDTGSAVAAVPGEGNDWAYISSGTWSLVGRELMAPIRTRAAMDANFTNERGVGGTTRFHKNIAGLWLLQECQRIWNSKGHDYTFDRLCEMANDAPAFAAFIDPDAPGFGEFGDMPAKVRAFCERTGQPAPTTHGAVVRCILESLALKCRVVIESLEALTGPVRRVHIVGGGVQNALLCQFTADALARPVLAGPVEATAAGNILTQALAHGRVHDLVDIRRVIRGSFTPVTYEPRQGDAWAGALDRFRRLTV